MRTRFEAGHSRPARYPQPAHRYDPGPNGRLGGINRPWPAAAAGRTDIVSVRSGNGCSRKPAPQPISMAGARAALRTWAPLRQLNLVP